MNPLTAHPGRLRSRLIALASAALLIGPAIAAPALKWSAGVSGGLPTNDRTKAIGMMNNGDVVAASQIDSFTSGLQIRVQRFANGTGTATWTRDVGSTGADDAVAIAVDPATGDTFVAARSSSSGSGLNWLVFKVNGGDGGLGWTTSYTFGGTGNDQPRAIVFTSDNHIAVAGMETVNGNSRLRVTKINASTGSQIWNYTDAADGTDALALAADASGNVIAAGIKGSDAMVVKLGSNGLSSWSQIYNGVVPGYDAWNAIIVLSSGDLAVAGYVVGVGGQNFAVARYSSAGGAATWMREINGTANADDAAYDLTRDSSDNLYAVGLLRDSANGQTGHVARLAPATGEVAWSASKNGSSSVAEATDAFFSVRVAGDYVFAAGTQADLSNQSNILVSRYTTAGTFRDDTVVDGTAHKADLLLSRNLLATSGTNLFAVGGDGENSGGNTDGVVRAYLIPALPVITSPTVANLTDTSVKLGGNITSGGGEPLIFRGVVLAKTADNNNPRVEDPGVISVMATSANTGVFTFNVSDLVPGTAYSFKAVANNGEGYGYTSVGSFTTLTSIENWRLTWYGSTANTGNAADTASPYGTGIPNLLAFAFFGPSQNPALAKINMLPQKQLSGGNLSYSFTPPAGVTGITFGAESSTTLLPGSWQVVPNTGTTAQRNFSVPVTGGTKKFLRLKVTNP